MKIENDFYTINNLKDSDNSMVRRFGLVLEKRYKSLDHLGIVASAPKNEVVGIEEVYVLFDNGIEAAIKSNERDEYKPGQLPRFDVEYLFIPYNKIDSIKEKYIEVGNTSSPDVLEIYCGSNELKILKGKMNGVYSSEENGKDLEEFIKVLKAKLT